ncbi:hypothetical protein ASE78_10605 [Sphingomonas sp. Leaf25]|nr:hypothetical protein ASE78_10605 [Sphingomonas sp. Leaf25]
METSPQRRLGLLAALLAQQPREIPAFAGMTFVSTWVDRTATASLAVPWTPEPVRGDGWSDRVALRQAARWWQAGPGSPAISSRRGDGVDRCRATRPFGT